jgi:hypothetical protein
MESRYGRYGRGRLWVADEFPDVTVDPWPDTALAKYLGPDGQGAAGIVIWAADAHKLADFPGIITDIRLRRWTTA